MKKILCLWVLLLCYEGYSQHILKGKVVHSKTNEPLPFVNIAIKNSRNGTTSDVEGRFSIELSGSEEIQFSFVGFDRFTYRPTIPFRDFVIIKLNEKSTELQEVVIRPGDNPALKIIRKSITQKPFNDPEKLHSFSYNAYNKLFMTIEGFQDSVANPLQDSLANLLKDTTLSLTEAKKKKAVAAARAKRFKKFADNNHLFVTESYTERKYAGPNLTKETVLANKMTGVKDPFFAFLATDFQPFSFYKDLIPLFGKNYLNPISDAGLDRYDYTIVDTVYHQTDSIFIITFEPLPGKQFESLKGQLYLSSDGYALEHVIAQPADNKVLIEARIQQKYEKHQGHWFPVQLNTELRFKEYKIGKHNLMYVSRSYLTHINIGQEISKKEFGLLNVEFDPKANRQDETFWSVHRTDSLGRKEKNTYHLYDSLGPKLKSMNRMMNIMEGMMLGRFKAGAFYVPLEYLVKFNKYEGVRLGMALRTSEQISKFFTLEGYAGYGFEDKATKYGGSLQFNLVPRNEGALRFSYQQDLNEPGSSNFIKNPGPSVSNQSLRNWLTSRMDSIQQYKVEFEIRPFRFSQMNVFVRQQNRQPTYTYSYITSTDPVGSQKKFIATEVGLQWRYAFRENYTQIGNGKVVTNYAFPQINLFVSQAVAGLGDGTYDFKKVEVQLDQHWITPIGKTTVQLDGGQIMGNVPYPYLFNGKGSQFDNTLLSNFVINNYFQTVGLYEFASDQLGYLFFTHNFGRIAGANSRYFRPELSVVQNIGYGSLQNPSAHQGIIIKTMDKGFFESGLTFENLFRFKYVHLFYYGIGLGAYYRYGTYALPSSSDNFALKLIINASF